MNNIIIAYISLNNIYVVLYTCITAAPSKSKSILYAECGTRALLPSLHRLHFLADDSSLFSHSTHRYEIIIFYFIS